MVNSIHQPIDVGECDSKDLIKRDLIGVCIDTDQDPVGADFDGMTATAVFLDQLFELELGRNGGLVSMKRWCIQTAISRCRAASPIGVTAKIRHALSPC